MFMFLGRDVTRAAGPSARRPRVPGGVDLAVLVGAHERARGGRRGAAGGCVHAGGRRLTAAAAPAPRQPSPVDRAAPAPAAHVIAHIDSIGVRGLSAAHVARLYFARFRIDRTERCPNGLLFSSLPRFRTRRFPVRTD